MILQRRSFAIVGVIWPSKEFDELVAVAGGAGAAGRPASLGGGDAESLQALEDKLRADEGILHRASAAADSRRGEGAAARPRRQSVGAARLRRQDPLLARSDGAPNKEDASDSFFKDDGNELMKNLKVDEDDLDEEVAGTGGGASLPLGVGAAAARRRERAGLKELLSGFKAAAMNVLNFTTYFEMKARAGTVGKNGVAKLIDQLAAASAAHSPHRPQLRRPRRHGGSRQFEHRQDQEHEPAANGLFAQWVLESDERLLPHVVDRQRVNGPILVTHTKNDKAVGVAYPLASRINGDKTAAFGDENDVFGGIGRNGARRWRPARPCGKLLAVGASYAFQAGKFFNLEASDFIKDHGDVTGRKSPTRCGGRSTAGRFRRKF